MKTIEFIVVMVAQLSEYTKTTELHTSEKWIVWHVSYISIALLLKKIKFHQI